MSISKNTGGRRRARQLWMTISSIILACLFAIPILVTAGPDPQVPSTPSRSPALSGLRLVAKLPVVEVQLQPSPDKYVWGNEVTVNSKQMLRFRWHAGQSPLTAAEWRLTDALPGPNANILKSGPAGPVPQEGKVTYFDVDLNAALPGTASPGKSYWLTVKGLGADTSESLAVKINYRKPNIATVFTPSGLDEPVTENLEAIRKKYKVPGLAGAIVTSEGVKAITAVGIRKVGYDTPVTGGDQWHIGSDTKAMTATLIAIMIDKPNPVIGWDTTIVEVFPEFQNVMQPGYRDVTVLQLLQHRGGIEDHDAGKGPRYSKGEIEALETEGKGNTARRYLFTHFVLTEVPPASSPGTTFEYANQGYIIAANMLERRANRSWERLMIEELFEPLGMESAGFGVPGTPMVGEGSGVNYPKHYPDQPRPHRIVDGICKPRLWDNPDAAGPAGNVHVNMRDWAKFIRLHLNGREGHISLSQNALDNLHNPPVVNGMPTSYAGGWGVTGSGLAHDGSNTHWYARAALYMNEGFAVIVATNCADANGDPRDTSAVGEAEALLRDYYKN